MQFLYISTLKNQVYPPKEKNHTQHNFFRTFFPFWEFIFLFGIFFCFFLYSSERQIEFWRIIKDYVQYFPSLF